MKAANAYAGFGIALLLAGCARPAATPPQAAPPAAYSNPYSNPLSTPGAWFGALPVAVQNTVRSEAGTAEIVDVRKEMSAGRTYYKITFRDPRIFPPILVAADGSVLNPDLTVAVPAPQPASPVVTLSELPAEARKVIQERQAGADIAAIHAETWGDHTVYIVSFKDEAHRPKLYILADGNQLIPAAK